MQKRACLGAAFATNYDALPATNASVVWEMEEVADPPAHLRPTKPKMWLLGTTVLKAGFYYLLQ